MNLFFNQEPKCQSDPGLFENVDSISTSIATEARSSERTLRESNSHGGSWLDSFKDDSGIDWLNSDQLNLSDDKVKIGGGVPIPLKVDSNTMTLWHFNEGSGAITYDETNNDNDGNINGPSWTTGKFNSALSYNGGNDRVDVASDPSLNFGAQQSFTIEAWVKTDQKQNNIICKYVDGTPGYYQLYTMSNGLVQFKVQCTNTVTNRLYSSNVITDNNWHYIAVVRDTSKDLFILYIDGVLSSLCLDPTTGSISTPGPVYIGKHFGGSALPFSGKIDEIRISNNARTPWEIAINYGLYKKTANITTNPIDLPINMHWDTLIINKTQPENTYLNITIQNASNNQQIPGTPQYIDNGEFDISYIDAVQYPSIRLNATFRGNGSATPILFYWDVSWNATNAWRDSFFSDLKGSYNNLTKGEGEIWASPSPSDWNKYPNNPILTISSSGWDDFGVGRSSILFNGTGYMMWYEGRPAISGWDIGFATSSDGLTWTKYSGNPVMTRGTVGNWDDEAIGCPSVLFDGTVYKMWYMGRTISPDWGIGYATSVDGINWQKHFSNPIFDVSGGGSWESKSVANPFVYYANGIYKMWYRGANSNNHLKVGLATSSNGIIWARNPNNPVLVGPSGNNIGVNHLSVFPEKDRYHGWYSFNTGSDWKINQATSTDGINWINYSNNPVLQKGVSSWDDDHVFYPFVILKNRQYLLYYQGMSQGVSKIGLAKSKFSGDAVLNSTTITIPSNNWWDTLIINKTKPTYTYLNVTILDATTNQPIPMFENLTGTTIDVSSIDPHKYNSIKLQANFESNIEDTSILHDWSINWTLNTPPKVLDFQTSSSIVYRTNTTQFTINISDMEESIENLTLDIYYRSPTNLNWYNSYLTDQHYENNFWLINFTPTKNAELGEYSFNVSCNDSFLEFDNKIFYDVITVLNNPPTQPDVVITPTQPKTLDDLIVNVFNVTDIEDEPITYFYEWYKDGELQPGLNTELVPSSNTAQNEVWKCIVTPNDGNENGTSGEAEITIQNTPPEINHSLLSITFLEDNIDHSLNLFYTFKDSDFDALIFEVEGDDKLEVNIFENGTVELIPEPNWFGSEILTFYANDNLAEINDSVVVKVLPTNDEPVLTEIIGPKKTYLPSLLIEIKTDEDEWLNLTVNAYDIDGDDLTYSTNRTDKIGLDDLSNLFIESNIISYLPTNDDVGVLTLNVTVSDNNGSEIYQNLEIEIQNTNDPPTVKITYPTDGSAFETTDTINFSCEWSDVDFDVPEPTEHLTFTWYTNHSTSKLGQGEILTNKTLVAGFHTITLEVEDYDGEIAVDSINITVTDPPPPPDVETQSTTKTENLWWLILIVIVVIIVILIILFGVLKRKKQAKEAEKAAAESDALIPEIVGKPGAEPLPATPTVPIPRQLTPSVTPTPVVQVQAPPPTPALEGVQPTIRPGLPPAQVEEKKELSKDEKLKLLEERLIKGDIDQELYEELKQKLLTEEEPTVTEPPLTPTEVPEPSIAPVPKLKTLLIPKVVTPELKTEEEPPEVDEAPSQLEDQPAPPEEPAEELESEPTGVVCPQCQSDAIATYPDGSSSCSYCGNKWL